MLPLLWSIVVPRDDIEAILRSSNSTIGETTWLGVPKHRPCRSFLKVRIGTEDLEARERVDRDCPLLSMDSSNGLELGIIRTSWICAATTSLLIMGNTKVGGDIVPNAKTLRGDLGSRVMSLTKTRGWRCR